jgi:dTDP-4-amino-4,6-dideoxygalactose transaminase
MIGQPNSLRIGGEFEFDPDAYKRSGSVEPIGRPANRACLWTDTGRSALLIAASAIQQRGGKRRAWVPAFSCEAISQALRQAGLEIQYYSAGLNGEGERSVPEPDTGDILVFIHYFGHRNGSMAKAAEAFRKAGIWVVEDAVQGSLMRGLGDCGDFAVTSYRKVLPVVDGAALFSREPVDFRLAEPDESFVSARLIGKTMRGAQADAAEFLPLFQFSEDRLQHRIVPRRMSWLSTWMLERLDWSAAIARRRANWSSLSGGITQAAIGGLAQPVFDVLEHDDVPLGFPIRVTRGQRDRLRHFLAEREIYCPVHWPLAHLGGLDGFPRERELEASLLTLPIDQRMGPAHIERLVETLVSFD